MKNIFLSISALIFFAVFVKAQNSSPYWSLAGNSNATSSSKLGTTNAINLRFYTNNSERARITTSGLFGIGTTSPTDKLHVNSAPGTNAFRAQVNGSTKFIVASNGNVGIGTSSPNSSYKLHVINTLTYGTGTYTSGYSYGLQAYATSSSGYGIYSQSPYLGVYAYGGTYGTYSYGGTYGVYGYSNTTSSSPGYGVYGSGYYGLYGSGTYGVYGTGGSSGYGVYGSGYYGLYGTGTYGLYAASSSTSGYGALTYGGYGGTYGSGSQYGLYGYSADNYGVYGYTSGNASSSYGRTGVYGYCASYGYGVRGHSVYGSGIYGSGGSYAGYFSGDIYTTGSYLGSDRKLKKNVTDIESGMELINKLHPKSYEFRQDGNFKLMHLPNGKHYGLIAQELEQVLPQLVKDTKFDTRLAQADAKLDPTAPAQATASQSSEVIDFKAVNYTELISIIIKGMQEQQATIEKQNVKIEELTELVNKLAQNTTTGTNVKFFGTLNDATPNPASSITRISYTIPTNISRAELIINDADGQKVKQISLTRSGYINLDTSKLSSGTYFYSLIVNGVGVATKRMVVVTK